MNDENTRTAIILLTMQDTEDTTECLASLGGLRGAEFLPILVCNGSSDETISRICGRFPDVCLIRNEENLGFAEGCNAGIRAAVEEMGCTHILLLNNDTTVAPDALEEMLRAFSSAPDIAAVGAKIYFHDRPNVIDHVGGVMDCATAVGTHAGIFEEDRGQYETLRECDYTTGAAMLASAEMFEKVGLLDSTYFNYFEDADWCARARSLGGRIVVNPRAKVWHKISRTVDPLWTLYVDARNRGLYILKNFPENFDRFLESYSRDLARMFGKFDEAGERLKMLAAAMGFDDFCAGRFGRGRIDEVRAMRPGHAPPRGTRARLRRLGMLARRTPEVLERHLAAAARNGMKRWPAWAAGNAPRRRPAPFEKLKATAGT